MSKQIDQNYNRIQLEAILKWFADIDAPRANFLVDNDVANLPKAFADTADESGMVVLNMLWKATRDLTCFDTGVEFKCGRQGVGYTLFVPYKAIVGFQTEQGLMLYNYYPTESDIEEPEQWFDGSNALSSDYRPTMQRLALPEVKEEVAKQVRDHLKLVHGSRTKKDVTRDPVDPKLQSYPFPEDRFAEYNTKRNNVIVDEVPVEEYRFKGTPQGIQFHSRARVKRERPVWMRVIEGGKK